MWSSRASRPAAPTKRGPARTIIIRRDRDLAPQIRNSSSCPALCRASTSWHDDHFRSFPRKRGPSWIPACAGMSGEFCFPKPYATSHEELDADKAIQEEVRNAARTLIEALRATAEGKMIVAGEKLKAPRQK